MADQKVTALTAKTTLVGTELVYIIDDPAGTPTSKKATTLAVANLAGKMYSAAVSQTGTDAPTILEFHNTSGLTVAAFYNSVGNYAFIFTGYVVDREQTAISMSGTRGFLTHSMGV